MSNTKVIEVNGKLYRVGPKGMKGSRTYLGPATKKASFFNFNVTDNLKKAAKNLGMDIK